MTVGFSWHKKTGVAIFEHLFLPSMDGEWWDMAQGYILDSPRLLWPLGTQKRASYSKGCKLNRLPRPGR